MADYQKNIGTIGSISLLISSITGPGLITLPVMFQSAGWLVPTVAMIIIPAIATLGALFLMEAMTYFPENEEFGRNTELTVLVHHFYGRKWYYFAHIIVYGSLQSFNIASIISGIQQFDQLLVGAFNSTCGFGISPKSGLFCTVGDALSDSASPFGNNYMFLTLGGVILLCCLLPLVNLNLSDNMIVQFISIAYLCFVIVCWIAMSFANGLDTKNLPTVGPDTSGVLGSILFNYTLANTVPSWVNGTHKRVNLKKTLWKSTIIATTLYYLIGLFGALGFDNPNGLDIITLIATSPHSSQAAIRLNNVIMFTFPILVYITSIPVSMIIVRLNLQSSGIMGRGTANFCAVILPLLVVIPFQTGTWLTIFANWTSLIFQTLCNFIMPFMIYIFLHKRNLEMRQSVLDELDFLDFGGISRAQDQDEDYDFVYHLPHADSNRLVPRHSVSEYLGEGHNHMGRANSVVSINSINNMYRSQNHRLLCKALDPNYSGKKETVRSILNQRMQHVSSLGTSHTSRMLGPSRSQSTMGINSNISTLRRPDKRDRGLLSTEGTLNRCLNSSGTAPGVIRSGNTLTRPLTLRKRPTPIASVEEADEDVNQDGPIIQITIPEEETRPLAPSSLSASSIDVARQEGQRPPVHPLPPIRGYEQRLDPLVLQEFVHAKSSSDILNRRNSSASASDKSSSLRLKSPSKMSSAQDFKIEDPKPQFHALPLWIRNKIPSKWVAVGCMLLVTGFAIYVLAQNIMLLSH